MAMSCLKDEHPFDTYLPPILMCIAVCEGFVPHTHIYIYTYMYVYVA